MDNNFKYLQRESNQVANIIITLCNFSRAGRNTKGDICPVIVINWPRSNCECPYFTSVSYLAATLRRCSAWTLSCVEGWTGSGSDCIEWLTCHTLGDHILGHLHRHHFTPGTDFSFGCHCCAHHHFSSLDLFHLPADLQLHSQWGRA